MRIQFLSVWTRLPRRCTASLRLASAGSLDSFTKLFRDPRIEALTGDGSSGVDLAVQFRGDSGQKLAGKRLVRRFAALLAELQIVVD